MKSQGQIETDVCVCMARFEHEHLRREPTHIRAHLFDDFLIVRLQGMLTNGEKRLVQSMLAEKGRDLLKQVRAHLIETASPVMKAMIAEATGVGVLSVHHDISTTTGEEIVIFTLVDPPVLREQSRGRSSPADGQSTLISS